MYLKYSAATFLSAALLTSTAASAATLSGFGDPTDEAALAGGSVITFDNLAAGEFGSVTDQGVTFSAVGGGDLSVGSSFNGRFNTNGDQSLYTDSDRDPSHISISFSSAVGAFAFNWGAADYNWLLTAFDAGNNVVDSLLIPANFGSNAGDYFGISGAGITSASLVNQGSGDWIFIDNFTYDVAAVPVPAGLPLILSGLGFFGFMRLRRNKTA